MCETTRDEPGLPYTPSYDVVQAGLPKCLAWSEPSPSHSRSGRWKWKWRPSRQQAGGRWRSARAIQLFVTRKAPRPRCDFHRPALASINCTLLARGRRPRVSRRCPPGSGSGSGFGGCQLFEGGLIPRRHALGMVWLDISIQVLQDCPWVGRDATQAAQQTAASAARPKTPRRPHAAVFTERAAADVPLEDPPPLLLLGWAVALAVPDAPDAPVAELLSL